MPRNGLLLDRRGGPCFAFVVAAGPASTLTRSRLVVAGAVGVAVLAVACSDVPEKSTSKTQLVGADGGPLATCPAQMATYKPKPWHPPRPVKQRKCTEAQGQAVLACYLAGQAKAPECQAFVSDPANADCISCALSQENDPTLGPIIYDVQRGSGRYNFGGCVAGVTNDPSATGCGAQFQAQFDCEFDACECAANSYFLDCRIAARQTVCSKFTAACATQAALTCEGVGPSFWFGTGVDGFLLRGLELIRLFCG